MESLHLSFFHWQPSASDLHESSLVLSLQDGPEDLAFLSLHLFFLATYLQRFLFSFDVQAASSSF